MENEYWVEAPIAQMGKAMSIFVREVTTVDEDFHYLFGYAFFGLFTDLETPGVTKELVIGHVINNHTPTTENTVSAFSSTLYIR